MQRIILFLLLPLMTNAQMVRFGGNVSGITVTQIQGDTFRVKGNFNDITGVSIGTQLQAGDIYWSPALNAGDTCRRMVVVSADTLFAGFVNFQVNVLGQGSPSTQNSKLMRETPNQSLDYIPQGGNEALRECISQYYSNILDNLLGQGGGLASVLVDSLTIVGDGLTDTLKVDTNVIATIQALNDSLANYLVEIDVDSVTIFGDGVNTPLYADTSVLVTITALNDTLSNITAQVLVDSFTIVGNGLTDSLRVDTNVVVTWSALQDSLGDGMYQETFIATGSANVYQVTLAGGILPDDKSDILVLRNGVVLDAGYIINLDGANGQLELSFMPDTGDEIVIIWFNGDVAVSVGGGGGGVDSVYTDGVTALGNGLLIDKIRVDTTLIATQTYVANAIAQSGAGDITGVNAGFGISGGGLSGDVTVNVDSNVISTQNYVTNAIAPKLDSVFVDMFLFGNGTQINPLSIDTMYVASKEYVDNSVAAAGGGDITGVNETPQYGIIGGAASGAVSLRVDSTIIANKTWVQGQGYLTNVTLTGDVTGTGTSSITTTIANDAVALGTKTSGNYVATGAVSGNGLSGSASSEGATFTVTSNATNANTPSTIVYRDASGNFNAGTITAALTGNASTATTLQNARTINGTSFNGSANITVPVNTTNRTTSESGHLLFSGTTATGNIPVYTNTNIRVNPATSTITATLNGTATQVSNTLDAGYGLTGSSYTGANQRTWAVDTVNIASKSWVSGQIGGGGVTSTNGSFRKLAAFSSATNIDGGANWRFGSQGNDPVLTNSTDPLYYTFGALTDKFSVFGRTYLTEAQIDNLSATTFSVTNFGVSNLTVTNNATFNGAGGLNSYFNPGGQLGVQTLPNTSTPYSITALRGAHFNTSQNSLDQGDFRISSGSISNMFFVDAGLNAIGIGGASPNSSFNLNLNNGLNVNNAFGSGIFNGLNVNGSSGNPSLLFVSPNANSVGIAQGLPASFVKLDVNGSQRIYNNSLVFQGTGTGSGSILAGTRFSLGSNSTTFNIDNQNAGTIRIYTGGDPNKGLEIGASTGNVTVGGGGGIGKLNVNGDVDIAAGSSYRINGVAIGTTTINNNGNQRLITGSNTANTLNGESSLIYENPYLSMTSSVSDGGIIFKNSVTGSSVTDGSYIAGIDNAFYIVNNESASIIIQTANDNNKSIQLNSAGAVRIPTLGTGSAYDLGVSTNGTLQAFTSDTTLKENIIDNSIGIETVKNIETIKYNWKDREEQGNDIEIGFNAQNLEKVLPEAIFKIKSNGKLGIKKSVIIAVLTKAIQEQQEMIEQLQNEIKELKK